MPDRVASTLPESIETQARKSGARVLLKDKRDKVWTDHSWTEISEAAGKLRAGLASLGVKPGDRVAILSENCPEWIVVDQAVLGLGAVVVPLYTTSGAEETTHVINDSGAKIVAVNGPDLLKKILGLQNSLPNISAIIAMHPGAESVSAANGGPHNATPETRSARDAGGIVQRSRSALAVRGRVVPTVEAAPPFRQKMFPAALAVGTRAAEYRQRGKSVPAHLAIAMPLFRRIVFARIRAIFGSRMRYLIAGGAPLPPEIN